MAWHVYHLVYRLESPLHIGWRRTGNLMQTRHYVPGRNWWGAATSHLVQWLHNGDYKTIGEFVQKHLIFSYFFLADNKHGSNPFIPQWCQKKGMVYYGKTCKYSADEFECKFVRSLASTAIEGSSNTAAEGQLHEVEFVVPRIEQSDQTEAERVFLVGYLLARENSQGYEVRCENQEVYVANMPLLERVLRQVRIGGERRYGFGQMRLHHHEHIAQDPKPTMFEYPLVLDGEYPRITLGDNKPVPAHLLIDTVQATGEIEPLLGREWHPERGPGRQFSTVHLCWAPGAVTRDTLKEVTILPMGLLQYSPL